MDKGITETKMSYGGGLAYELSGDMFQKVGADIRNDIYSLGIILQQILPEHRYKGIINKCFLPIHARYQNVSQILQDIHLKKKSGI